MKRKAALFPGCTLEGSSSGFQRSLECVFDELGVACEELRGWTCCGASSAHALDHELHLALNMRNLALAEEQGFNELLAPCAACYHRLALAAHELNENESLRTLLQDDTGTKYGGTVTVRNLLDFLANSLGPAAVASRVRTPLEGLKAACYYGCLNTRTPRMATFDDREYPTSMDEIVRALGAETLDWSHKTECCGASLFVTNPDVSARLVGRILDDAVVRGADCIVVSCPMCQNNLDAKQDEIRAQFGVERPIPVLFLTQLIGLAYGIDPSRLAFRQLFVPADEVVAAAGGKPAQRG